MTKHLDAANRCAYLFLCYHEYADDPDQLTSKVNELIGYADPYDDPAYVAFLREQESQCGASYVTGGNDPTGTDCDLQAGHAGSHAGTHPFNDDARISWAGGGSVAGDSLPYHDVRGL